MFDKLSVCFCIFQVDYKMTLRATRILNDVLDSLDGIVDEKQSESAKPRTTRILNDVLDGIVDEKHLESAKPRTKPIIATLRSSTCVFEVRCEDTNKWLTPAYNTFGWKSGKKQDEWKETLKTQPYRFHTAKEEYGTLWITPPVGFWLKDGRLVSPDYKDEAHIDKGYYGKRQEITDMGRTIRYVTDGPHTFLPTQ